MPIYEFECQKCGEVFEVMQKVSDPSPKSHSCGSTQVKRIMSQTSFILKGTGWYATDYGRKGNNSTAATNNKNGNETKEKTNSSDKKDESKSAELKSTDSKSTEKSKKDKATAA